MGEITRSAGLGLSSSAHADLGGTTIGILEGAALGESGGG